MRGLYYFLIAFSASSILLSTPSCSDKKNDSTILSHAEMVKIMSEIYINEHKVSRLNLRNDSAKIVFEKFKDRVFEKHGVPDSVFKKSFDYYVERPKELEDIYTAVVDSLNLKEQQLNVSTLKEAK